MNDIIPANNELAIPVDGHEEFIKSRIFTIRGVQVILDRDLAVLYGVTTGRLNEQVKRNINRFPSSFMFQLSSDEFENWKSQNATSNSLGFLKMGARKRPYAFTEHGILMLASVLKSGIAVDVSIKIMNTFVSMRKTLASMAPFLSRMDNMERRQIADQAHNEERFDLIFKAMDGDGFPPQKVFFNGRHYEAYSFASKLVRKAQKSIVLVDGYCDEVTLDILSKKRGGVNITIVTHEKSARESMTPTAVEKFNKQNPTLTVKTTGVFHDRFMIIDDTELYHFGASLKDLGRQYCAVSKLDSTFVPSILERI